VLGWGESVVEMVAADLQRAFPTITGFSPRSVWDMRRLYVSYTAREFLAECVREIDHARQVKYGDSRSQYLAETRNGYKSAPNCPRPRVVHFCDILLQKFRGGIIC